MDRKTVDYQYYYWGPFLFHSNIKPEECQMLLEEGKKVRDKSKKFTAKLAGHIEEEYELNSKIMKPLLTEYLGAYCSGFNNVVTGTNFLKPDFGLLNTWINYMKAGEFNPPHVHVGDLSYVIFLDMPNQITEEGKKFKGSGKGPGYICWIYGDGDHLYSTSRYLLPKTGDLFIFPANLRHFVFPSKSPVTRISLSGNVVLKQMREMKENGKGAN